MNLKDQNKKHALELLKQEENIKLFLDFCTNNTDLSFDNKLVVFGNNKNSTKVYDYDTWNEFTHIKRGSKGIQVYSDTSVNNANYVFDISCVTNPDKIEKNRYSFDLNTTNLLKEFITVMYEIEKKQNPNFYNILEYLILSKYSKDIQIYNPDLELDDLKETYDFYLELDKEFRYFISYFETEYEKIVEVENSDLQCYDTLEILYSKIYGGNNNERLERIPNSDREWNQIHDNQWNNVSEFREPGGYSTLQEPREDTSSNVTEMGENEVQLNDDISSISSSRITKTEQVEQVFNASSRGNGSFQTPENDRSEEETSKQNLARELSSNSRSESRVRGNDNRDAISRDEFLRKNFENNKSVLFSYYELGATKKERILALSKVYNVNNENQNEDYKFEFTGITIENQFYSWNEIDTHIKSLIKNNQYLTEDELMYYNANKNNNLHYHRTELPHSFSLFELYEEEHQNSTLESIEELPIETSEVKAKIEDEIIEEIERTKVNDPIVELKNYSIEDDYINVETDSIRYSNNINAVKLLKELEQSNTNPTMEQQKLLSQYVGWGGLSDAFDERKDLTKYNELKSLLTEDEYLKARESTTTAFYTQPYIIKSMYAALKSFGFVKGNILEPSMATGNFFGAINDENIKKSNLYGVEIDSISGRIAKQLYPNANIQINGFEKTNFLDNSFDVVIGNVPFGNFSVYDKKYEKNNFKIHDYFMAKAIDQVKIGGIVALITSKGTLDKTSSKVRRYMAERADLIGAIRLPNSSFKSSANTDVTSDILFFAKRDRPAVVMPSWVDVNMNFKIVKNEHIPKNINTEAEIKDFILDKLITNSTYFDDILDSYTIKKIKNISIDNYDNLIDEIENYGFDFEIKNEVYNFFVNKYDRRIFGDQFTLSSYRLIRELELIYELKSNGRAWEIKSDIREVEGLINKIYESLDIETIGINNYFIENPHMVLGDVKARTTAYGYDIWVDDKTENSISNQLTDAIKHLNYEYSNTLDSVFVENDVKDNHINDWITADITLPNFSYSIVKDTVYYRENGLMKDMSAILKPYDLQALKEIVNLKNILKKTISIQLEDCSENDLKNQQDLLNSTYDNYVSKYGLIDNKFTQKLLQEDNSYNLLSTLEKLDNDGNFIGKADIFSQRTIARNIVIDKVDTSYEALTHSMATKTKVDLEYMANLVNKDVDTIINDLSGQIFLDPVTSSWITADEYLSGNIRDKLKYIKAINDEKYSVNIEYLEKALPTDLKASEIDVRIGATWIPQHYITEFMREKFSIFSYYELSTDYSDYASKWNIKGKSNHNDNIKVTNTYGTDRINALQLTELALNLKTPRIEDDHPTETDKSGKPKKIVNEIETRLACQKQELIKEEFKNWIFKDIDRRKILVDKYNTEFNSIRPREYNGEFIKPEGMSASISLRDYQKNAVARIMFGGNTLLSHVVGAGKTWTMATAGMESKRLGLCNKPLYVVPNYLIGQWHKEFIQLYPNANILSSTQDDFTPSQRKKFCSKIATGNYDAIIISHSQFEKIPISSERKEQMIKDQIEDLENLISSNYNTRSYTVKQLEIAKKNLVKELEKHYNVVKDDVVTFEELGVDRIFVDEAHLFKNLLITSKMTNIAGLNTGTSSKRASDMLMKTKYLDEITNGKGVIFATGTPISNSMTELYVMQTYLQSGLLNKMNLNHFDKWASTFGEPVTALEIKPEGTGYQTKTRFNKFFNIPELMSLFKETADIQTTDMLNLPVPKANYHSIKTKPTKIQKDYLLSLSKRAEVIRQGGIDPSIDNMLKITSEGRKLALDERLLIDNATTNNEDNKINALVDNAFDLYLKSSEKKGTQIIFSDLSTPNKGWNVYKEIKDKLIEKGVPKNEIAFIHDANKEDKKIALFKKVNNGDVRFILGSTSKLGAGTNIQQKLVGCHHIDVPWRPSDIEQREGRIIRQKNTNKEVEIYKYVTEDTFDTYSWQTIENKQKFISQIITSKSAVRSADDVDDTALSYAEIKALATGNPYIKEKMDLDISVNRLKLLQSNYKSNMFDLQDKILTIYPVTLQQNIEYLNNNKLDLNTVSKYKDVGLQVALNGSILEDKIEINKVINDFITRLQFNPKENIPNISVNGLNLSFDRSLKFNNNINTIGYDIILKGKSSYTVESGADNYTRLLNFFEKSIDKIEYYEKKIQTIENNIKEATAQLNEPFVYQEELDNKINRLIEVDAILAQGDSSNNSNEEIDEKTCQNNLNKFSLDGLAKKQVEVEKQRSVASLDNKNLKKDNLEI